MSKRAEIKHFNFDDNGRKELLNDELSKDWPAVYLLDGKNNETKYIYIGETSSVINRFDQHIIKKENGEDYPNWKYLNRITCIFDDTFNKSAILDIEQRLIKYFSASVDENGNKQFKLLNLNGGQSTTHNYYSRSTYVNKLISKGGYWDQFRKIFKGLNDIEDITNSNLFKYSPYSSLTEEQENIALDILENAFDNLLDNKNGVSIINGSAGTGKTLIAIKMISLILDIMSVKVDIDEDLINEMPDKKIQVINKIRRFIREKGTIKIAFVFPMESIRSTICHVFSEIQYGYGKYVMGPFDLVTNYINEGEYDIVFVDEAHRLSTNRNRTRDKKQFKVKCNSLGMKPETTNQLDWILKVSKQTILFYDKQQRIKQTDITEDELTCSLKTAGFDRQNIKNFKLLTQMRCCGGNAYISFIERLFNCKLKQNETIKKNISQQEYDVKLFKDPNKMIEEVKTKEKTFGLCRVVAGYSWPWKTKKYVRAKRNSDNYKDYDTLVREGFFDIDLNNKHYIWNMTNSSWILSEHAIDTIGCVHTTQGYDLNYVGVILGKEIDYDPNKNTITIDRNKFYDKTVKENTNDDELKEFIINAYKVMMFRGIKGCYIYACNKNMQKYLEKYFPLGE